MYDYVRTIDAAVEPITLGQAKDHCRVDGDQDDGNLNLYIKAARKSCEKHTNRAFIQQTWKLSLDAFPYNCRPRATPDMLARFFGGGGHFYGSLYARPIIQIPQPKLIGIVSVTYLDASGQRQTLDPASYLVDLDGEPASISPVPGTTWPFALCQPGSVQITFTAGYGSTADAVPETIKLAILMLVGHFYENREATILPTTGTGPVEIPLGVQMLLNDETFTSFTFEG